MVRNLVLFLFTISIFSCRKKNIEPTKSSAKKIVSFEITISNQQYLASIDSLKKSINLTLPFGTAINQLSPSISISSNSIITPASNVPQDFSKLVIYKVTAEDGSSTNYSVNIIFGLPKNSEKKFNSGVLSIGNQEIKINVDTVKRIFSASVPFGTNVSNLSPEIDISSMATLNPVSGSPQDFTSPVQYTITAEDGSKVVYTFIIEINKPNSADLQKLSNSWENIKGLNIQIKEVDKNGIIWGRKYKNEQTDVLVKYQNGAGKVVNISKLQSKKINDITEFNNSIWIGTSNGLFNIDGEDTLTYNLSNLEIENNVKSFNSFENQLYCLTTNSIFKFENNKWLKLVSNPTEKLIDFVVVQDFIYIITENSILEYNGTFKKFTSTETYASFEKIKIDSKGIIWISNWWGMVKFENDRFIFYNSKSIKNFPDTGLENFIIDKHDIIWMAWGKHGVLTFDNGSIINNFNTINSNIISDNTDNIILKNNILYVGCFKYLGENLPRYAISKLRFQ